jgi:hypothetical protein
MKSSELTKKARRNRNDPLFVLWHQRCLRRLIITFAQIAEAGSTIDTSPLSSSPLEARRENESNGTTRHDDLGNKPRYLGCYDNGQCSYES